MDRIVEREWLDELPANDPRAERSRRDIQRINLLTGHDRIVARALKRAFPDCPPSGIADLGAGNGRLLLSVARRFGRGWKGVNVTLVDRVNGFEPGIVDQFAGLGWRANIEIADALAWLRGLGSRRIEAVATNHFLHQIEDVELREMLSLLARSSDAVIAAEPRRGAWPLLCSRFVWLVGSAPVTRYDAPVSVRAGFTGREISALWPDKENWDLIERGAGWVSHLFIARRKKPGNASSSAQSCS